jgi:AraC-like DNA-binding protein
MGKFVRMIKDNLHEPFQIVLKELIEKCPRPAHKHNFFEVVYIVSGTGQHFINDSNFKYRAGHLFLLTPDDSHHFDVDSPTRFFFIRFNDFYIKSNSLETDAKQRLEFILKNANREPGCILKNDSDKLIVKPIIEAIMRESVSRDLYNKELIRQYVKTLIVIMARNISQRMPEAISEGTEEKAVDILQYIQTNILSPEKIRTNEISRQFGISETYLGRYFKKHANETMQQYITNYKLKLIENRLLHSNMRITEIADEMGFTDKSHLNRIFKKYKGVNPSDFRKTGNSAINL